MSDDFRTTPLDLIPRSKVTEDIEGLNIGSEFKPNPEFAAPRALDYELEFRHSGWAATRKKTWDALNRTGCSVANLDRFAECGSQLRVEVNVTDQAARLTCNKCKNRWCIACGNDRAAKIAANLQAAMNEKNTTFITLTRRHSHASLADQIDGIYEAFAKLRRRNVWKNSITGGAAFLEVKLSERTGLWHPHLHIICEGTYLPQRLLSAEWQAVTLDSSIVDIRKIRDLPEVASYVTKYVTKPASSTVVAVPEKFDEAMCAMKGRRLCLTFGKWRGIKLDESEPPTSGWTSLGRVTDAFASYLAGDRAASIAVRILLAKFPRLAKWMPHRPAEGPDEWVT